MIKYVGKRGDTLIEVMLAVGIFSMVAVAVVAVMSGGTSSAQTALETTLAREEIDAQAEALRFVHSAYIADKNAGTESKFGTLWNEIKTNYSVEIKGKTDEYKQSIVQYSPATCQDLYNESDANNIYSQKAFVLNPKELGTFTETGEVLISGTKSSDNSKYLTQATTYPRLVYSNSTGSLVSDSDGDFSAAEGIYIIAVKDPDTTKITGNDSATSAYYDFYIRTCWYGTGDQNPSTISTVMRLYDPDAIKK